MMMENTPNYEPSNPQKSLVSSPKIGYGRVKTCITIDVFVVVASSPQIVQKFCLPLIRCLVTFETAVIERT